jgi:hypothetical protein
MNELSRSIATETHLHSLAAADGHRREITPANLLVRHSLAAADGHRREITPANLLVRLSQEPR